MFRGDLDDRLEAEFVELHRSPARPLVVRLVDRHQHRHGRLAKDVCDLLVARDQTLASVHDEHDDVRGFQRPSPVHHDKLMQRILVCAEHPASIDKAERVSQPLGRQRD